MRYRGLRKHLGAGCRGIGPTCWVVTRIPAMNRNKTQCLEILGAFHLSGQKAAKRQLTVSNSKDDIYVMNITLPSRGRHVIRIHILRPYKVHTGSWFMLVLQRLEGNLGLNKHLQISHENKTEYCTGSPCAAETAMTLMLTCLL